MICTCFRIYYERTELKLNKNYVEAVTSHFRFNFALRRILLQHYDEVKQEKANTTTPNTFLVDTISVGSVTAPRVMGWKRRRTFAPENPTLGPSSRESSKKLRFQPKMLKLPLPSITQPQRKWQHKNEFEKFAKFSGK